MCGIVAIFSRRKPIAEGALERATASLHHRGPDGQRHWISTDRRIGPRPCAAQHHRSRNRRSADRQRGRTEPASSSTANSMATRRMQRELAGGGPPPAHPLGQRDRPSSLRRSRDAMPAPSARRIRLRALGRDATARCSPPATVSASSRCSMPVHDGHALLRLRSEGAVRRRRAGALGRRIPLLRRRIRRPPDAHPVRRRVPGAARALSRSRPTGMSQLDALLGFRLSEAGRSHSSSAPTRTTRRSFARRWRRRFACGCAPTSRSAAI